MILFEHPSITKYIFQKRKNKNKQKTYEHQFTFKALSYVVSFYFIIIQTNWTLIELCLVMSWLSMASSFYVWIIQPGILGKDIYNNSVSIFMCSGYVMWVIKLCK